MARRRRSRRPTPEQILALNEHLRSLPKPRSIREAGPVGWPPGNTGETTQHTVIIYPDEPEPARPPAEVPAADARDWRTIIAERIRDAEYSFNALGVEAGVSASQIMRFVRGERDLTVATAEKLCRVLDLILVRR